MFLSIVALSLLGACSSDNDTEVTPTEYYGERVSIGDGEAWTYVRTDDQQKPIAIGVQFDETALENLPTGSMHADEFVLHLPEDIAVPPFNHVTMDWNEHGHEPMMVYDLPHFDFHFYFMSQAERDVITPFDSVEFNIPLLPDYLAPMYLETPGGVPRMGAHIIDLLSPEIAGTGPFTHTFIYGKYDAQINFLEPMVTKAFLDSKSTIEVPIRQPQKWQKAGYYPTHYTIEYDESSKLYTLLLSELASR